MPTLAAVLASLALASGSAFADTATTAQSVVVVTPAAPVVVQTAAPAASLDPPGAAEMPPIPAATVGPVQNVEWGNVSHINGQLVPVGQRNDYLYRFKKINLATNPIGLLFGYYGASLSVAVSQNVAIRGDLDVWSTDHGSHEGFELGVSAPIFFRRTYSGPFFEPGLLLHGDRASYMAYEASCYDCSTSSTGSDGQWVGAEMLLGWQWMFDSGLNVAAAFGAARRLSGSSYDADSPVPAGYFRIGYAF